MVTEKYLLRSEAEWAARQDAGMILDAILAALRDGDIAAVGAATTRNFFEPLQTIIPWASNLYTEMLIEQTRAAFGDDFWGFCMLGGMSGGGMAFLFAPARKAEAQAQLQLLMSAAKRKLEYALPFAMEPVVYEFTINPHGTYADLLDTDAALLPPGYYALVVPTMLRIDPRTLSATRRAELDRFAIACRTRPELAGMIQTLFDRLLPHPAGANRSTAAGVHSLADLLEANGFDRTQHEAIRADLKSGRIGLLQNRLPPSTKIDDVLPDGAVAVVSLAGGAGSRWTQGAGVVKALHPFAKLGGRHRTFIETHLAKSRRIGQLCGTPLPHILTTSYLTHAPIADYLAAERDTAGRPYSYPGPLLLSPGRAVGLRLVPMTRDLRFAWEETPQQLLDEQAQKMRESLHAALIGWAEQAGEGSDYTDNLPLQCLHPVGHWFEVANLLRNGVLSELFDQRPQLKYLLLHNIDTLGADADPALLGLHIQRGACLSFEVIARRIEDRGGGLARVDGKPRLLEGLSMPREADEFGLSFYNSLTTWIDIDQLLAAFALSRADLADA